MHYAYGARRTVRGALRLDHATAAQVISRNYTAPVKKRAKYRVNLAVTSYYLTTILPFYGGEYYSYGTNYYLTTLLLQVVLTEWSYIVPQVPKVASKHLCASLVPRPSITLRVR